MKISNMFLTMLFIPIMLSCQSNKQDTRHVLLQRIARDSIYVAYQETITENAYCIATGKYDLSGIKALYDKYPEIANACGFHKIDLEPIKGGILYQEIHCKLVNLAEHLNAKFQFYKLPIDDLQEIQELYKRAHGNPNIANKIYIERVKN